MNLNTCAGTACATRESRPAYQTREDDAGIHLEVALPGVAKEDLKFSVLKGVLQLEAERRDGGNPTTYRLSAQLGERLDGEKITAKLENGVLTALVPLREEAQPKSIPVV